MQNDPCSVPFHRETLSQLEITVIRQCFSFNISWTDSAALQSSQSHIWDTINSDLGGNESKTEDRGDIWQSDGKFLTSAPWDRLLFLRAGEGSADRRGVRPPFFNSSPEGDFGTVHTGTPSEKWQGSIRADCQLSQWGGGNTLCLLLLFVLLIEV